MSLREFIPTPKTVVVTSLGIVSPLGFGRGPTERMLFEEPRDCTRVPTLFDTTLTRCKLAGEIDRADLAATLPKGRGFSRLHPASAMMIQALREALAGDQGFNPTHCTIGTTSGGMSHGEQFVRGLSGNGAHFSSSAALVANYMPQKAVLDALTALTGWRIPVDVVSNACASGSNAIGMAIDLIRSGKASAVLCGGYDALSELVYAGFDSLQASTPDRCRPFDRDRSGLVLGEGAAILFLESLESATLRGAPILAEAGGYGYSTDTFHFTQPNPDGSGPLRAMQAALENAAAQPDDVGYVNAHGTGTRFNDATEGLAISILLGNQTPVSSTKGMTGHALGAAGAIEAAFSILTLLCKRIPKNVNLREPDPELKINVASDTNTPLKKNCVLSNSFGFGGVNASLVFRGS